MFVLGVDPGLSRCGYAVVSKGAQGERAVTAGVIRTDPSEPMERRLAELHNDLLSVIAEFAPTVVAVERVFTNRNLKTAVSIGRASGVVLLAAAQSALPVFEYSPSEIKASVAGYGNATKDQIRYIVANRLRLPTAPQPADAADALAIALCHLQGTTVRRRIEAAT